MKAYLICIIGATLINFINEKLFLGKRKIISLLLFFISLLFICGIAGARNITVGFDITVYVTRLYNLAVSSDLIKFITHCNSDILFALLVYIGSIFKNINLVLFLIEFAVSLPIYIYAYKMKDKYNASFTAIILVFLLTMYCTSLSMMRQSIAMSICVLSYFYYDNNEKKKAYLIFLLACLFHKTAIIFLTIFIINKIIKSNVKDKNMLKFMLIAMIILLCLFVKPLVSLTAYSNYLELSSRAFSVGAILKRVFWLVLIILCRDKVKDNEYSNNLSVITILLIVGLLTTIMSFYTSGVGRIGYYFIDLANFLIILEVPKKFSEKKLILIVLLIIYGVLWWKSTCVVDDPSRVYPYRSDMVDFLN